MKEKKKVLLVVRWPVGGIRTFIRYVYRNFDTKFWSFTILAPDIPEMRILASDLSALNIRFVPIENNPSYFSFALSVTRELFNGRYDLVHSHGFTSGICSAFSAVLSHTTHLMTSHDVINENQFIGVKGILKKMLMGRSLDLIDMIHSVSHDAENNLLLYFPRLACRKGKSIVILNGIEIERFKSTSQRNLRVELGLEENIFLIGFFGRFMSQKGFRYLVDAIEILKNHPGLPIKPIVLTFGYGGYVREEMQAIKSRDLERYFYFMPFESNIAGVIKGLDVVVMPSLWEACPLLPMEVLSCGTPLIASDCIGMREVIEGTPTRIVPKAASNALAKAIENDIKISPKELFAKYRFEAMSRFNVKKTFYDIEKIYNYLTLNEKV